MKNVIKLALVLLTSLSIGFSANAGVLEVTGTAKATYNITSSDGGQIGKNLGKGLGITNELKFAGSGELDNGMTWSYAMEIDPGEAVGTGANDDTQMTLTTDYGTVGVFISEGDLDTYLKFSPAAYDAGVDVGIGGNLNPAGINGFNNVQYHTPAGLLPYSTSFKIAYSIDGQSGAAKSGNAAGAVTSYTNDYDDVFAADGAASTLADFSPEAVKDATSYQVITAPIEGLAVNASYIEIASSITDAKAQDYEAGNVSAKYSTGAFTFGVGRALIQPYVASGTGATVEKVQYVENTDYGIGYALNDNLSVSYEKGKSEIKTQAVDPLNVVTKSTNSQEYESIQAAYTMGGMTMAVSQTVVDGDGYTKESTSLRSDASQTLFVVTMAF
jgi:hypothetical protein